MKGKVVSIVKRQSQAGKGYWKVTVQPDDGATFDGLCFDAQIEKVGTTAFEFTTAVKGDATFINFPKTDDAGKPSGARSFGGARTDDPKTRIMSAHTMLLSYAKDIALQDPRGDDLGALLNSVREAYEYLHSLLFNDPHVKEVVK